MKNDNKSPMKTLADRPLRVAAYVRVSTTNQLRAHDGSIDTQLALITSRVEYERAQAALTGRGGWELVGVYKEEGRSAKNVHRPALQQLLRDARDGRFDAVVVTKIDRITRSLLDFYDLWNAFEGAGVAFISLQDTVETTTSSGRAMLKVTLVFAELERERTSERTKEKVATRRAQGLWFGGAIPFGLRRDPTNPTTLAVDDEAAPVLRKEIFAKFLEC